MVACVANTATIASRSPLRPYLATSSRRLSTQRYASALGWASSVNNGVSAESAAAQVPTGSNCLRGLVSDIRYIPDSAGA